MTTRHLKSHEGNFCADLRGMPDLPVISYAENQRPVLLDSPYTSNDLPRADVVMITWTEAEWAAMQQAFIQPNRSMSCSARQTSYWSGWVKYDKEMPYYLGSGWDLFGYYRLVEIAGKRVLLFKSNTHLDFPGE